MTRIEGYVCLVDDHGVEVLEPYLRAETAMLCGAAWGAHVVELYAILESSVALQVPDLPDVKIVAAEFRDHQSVAYYRWPAALERALLPGDVVTLRP